jgi:hypothetical protein
VAWGSWRGSGGGGFDGDFEAEAFELPDVVPLSFLRVDAAGEVVLAHLGVGDLFGEHPPDDDQQVVCDCDRGLFLAAAAGDPPEPGL